jgi:hypothetical protein
MECNNQIEKISTFSLWIALRGIPNDWNTYDWNTIASGDLTLRYGSDGPWKSLIHKIINQLGIWDRWLMMIYLAIKWLFSDVVII